jgi:hypothetical protein
MRRLLAIVSGPPHHWRTQRSRSPEESKPTPDRPPGGVGSYMCWSESCAVPADVVVTFG